MLRAKIKPNDRKTYFIANVSFILKNKKEKAF
jgi:hypothetical protein